MNPIRLKTFSQALLTFICALIGLMPMGVAAYTFDVNLPDYVTTFDKISAGYNILSNFHRNPNVGASPYYFPSTWQNLSVGQDLRIKVLLPPGTDAATLYIEAASMTANIGACDGVLTVCSTALGRASLSLWPNPPFGGGALTPLTSPRIVSFLVQAIGYPFDFSSMTITYHIADTALYENWRKVRNWAGGSGDCDGLGNAYCSGVTPTPTPTVQAAVAPPLGNAQSFAVLGASTVTNTGLSVVTGDLGLSPGTSVTGFPPGSIVGTIQKTNAIAANAQTDVTAAYTNLTSQPCNTTVSADLGGTTLTPGVYCSGSSMGLTGTVTLDAKGDPNAVFVFKMGSTLTTASNSSVRLINGGQSCNVFWQVGSAATLGTGTKFAGNILAQTSITLTTGASADGRVLARTGAVTMDSNAVSMCSLAAATSPTPTPFSISPASQNVAPGAAFTLTALNGTLATCLSNNTAVIPNPTVSADGKTATGAILAAAPPNSTANISCTSTSAVSSSAAVTVATLPAPATVLTITSIGISKLAGTSAAITATVSGAATGYWVAIPYATTVPPAPTSDQIKAGQDASGAAVSPNGKSGSGAMTASIAKEFSIANLTANSNYQVYFYAEDAAGSKTSVTPVAIVTNATATTPSVISATSGGSGNANLSLTTTIVPASNHTGAGSYYVAALTRDGNIYFLTGSGWDVWKGGALLPYSQEVLQSKTITILDGKLDLSSSFFTGIDIYAGYGIGNDLVAKKIYSIK